MGGAKPWQVAVIVIGLLAGIGLTVWSTAFSGETVEIASSMTLVDVTTGQLYEVPVPNRSLSYPLVNPETSQRTLIPAVQKDGQWEVPSHMRFRLKEGLKVDTKDVIDFKSGSLKVLAGEAKKVTLKFESASGK